MKKKQENQEEQGKKVPGCPQEEERLNLDELMDVEGGTDPTEPVQNCGLGCYLAGMSGLGSGENEKRPEP